MKIYLTSLLAGLLVGVLYSLLRVRSPAPPLVALVGLFGILVGEQLVPLARHILSGDATTAAATRAQTVAHVFGQLPGRNTTTREETRSND
jgi:XapX domain-containing protein